MRFLVRWAFRFLILSIVLVVALVLLKDVLVKALAEQQIEIQTGMDARIGRLELGVFSPTITVEDLRVYNPAEFGGSPMLEVPDLHIEYDPGALLHRQLHLRLVRVALAELNVVESREGRTNLVVGPTTQKGSTGSPVSDSILGFDFRGIDTLNLTLGKVRYSSLRNPSKATEIRLDLKNEIFSHIQSTADLTNAVLRSAFRNGITILSDADTSSSSGKPSRKNAARSRK